MYAHINKFSFYSFYFRFMLCILYFCRFRLILDEFLTSIKLIVCTENVCQRKYLGVQKYIDSHTTFFC